MSQSRAAFASFRQVKTFAQQKEPTYDRAWSDVFKFVLNGPMKIICGEHGPTEFHLVENLASKCLD